MAIVSNRHAFAASGEVEIGLQSTLTAICYVNIWATANLLRLNDIWSGCVTSNTSAVHYLRHKECNNEDIIRTQVTNVA